ncbi:MAG: ABC transporter permease [Acidobacteria bacterium]|nr:ABC transporter permease [Acidobacteriota bacterium]MCB9396586.1 ABC transporter permease [Acidobacteriota bacterium]
MRARAVFRFSIQALSGHGLRTGLSLIGIAIGVLAVVVLTAIGEGARRYVIAEFATMGNNVLIVVPGKVETTGGMPGMGGTENDLTLEDTLSIQRSLPSIRHIAPIATGTERVSFGSLSRDIAVIGTTSEFFPLRQLEMAYGQFLPVEDLDRGSQVCVIGSKVQAELFANQPAVGQVIRLGAYRFRVIGVLAKHGKSLGLDIDDVVIIPAVTCLKMFNKTSLFRIMISMDQSAEIEWLKPQVLNLLIDRHDGVEDVTLITQDAMMTTFTSILAMLTAVLVGIAAISLTVAGIGIMNVMLVTVSERTQEVGLLKALGATGKQVLMLFLSEAIVISLAGGLSGLMIGYGLLALFMRLVPGFDVSPPTWAAITAVLVSVLVGGIFGVMPARKAARLDPIDSLAGGQR